VWSKIRVKFQLKLANAGNGLSRNWAIAPYRRPESDHRQENTIALLVAEIETLFPSQVQRSIEPVAREHNRDIILSSVSDTVGKAKGLEMMRQQRVGGVILNSVSLQQDNNHTLDFRRTDIPLVAVNRYGLDDSVCQIIWDDETASTEAVLHLMRLGHPRIAHSGGPMDRHCHGDYLYPNGYNATLGTQHPSSQSFHFQRLRQGTGQPRCC
jgi:DNA-binding LacI/PurR family transcriptional regulator